MSAIVAFLQNPWHPPGTLQRHADLYRTNPRFRRLILRRSMTGGRLAKAFGSLYSEIHWDNANPLAVDHAAGEREYDLCHMLRVIHEIQPEIILTFGNTAASGVRHMMLGQEQPGDFIHLACHHPNARHRTQQDLSDFACLVQENLQMLSILEKSP